MEVLNLEEEWASFFNDNNNELSLENEQEQSRPEIDDFIPECSDIKISTKTKIIYLNQELNLNDLFWKIKIIPYDSHDNGIIKKQIKFNFTNKEEVAKFEENIVDQNKININFFLDQLDKSYVNKINIFGNFITEEKVIRNALIVDEGDPYNKILFDKSINNIKSSGIFKNVKSKILDDNNNNKVINITVEEKPTGEIFAGVGTGTGGSSFSAGLKEKNYLGKGITLDTNFSLSDDEVRGKFSVLNPNFRNSDRSLNTTIESTVSDFMTTSGYKTTRTGLSFGTGFEQFQDVYINFDV